MHIYELVDNIPIIHFLLKFNSFLVSAHLLFTLGQ